MPYYSKTDGIRLLKNEICDSCDNFPCDVYTDLAILGEESKWDQVRILGPGEKGQGVHCKSFKQYTPPTERPDPDPGFGKRISTVEANRYQGLPDDTKRNDVR